MLNFVSRKVAILSIYSYTYLTRKKYNITDIIEIDYGFTEKKIVIFIYKYSTIIHEDYKHQCFII